MPAAPIPETLIPAFSPGHDLAGRYRLIESLATSWAEETWSAYDVQTASQVALHVLPYLFVAEQQGLRELRQRGEKLQALPHPGLVRSLDFFVTSEAACYVTELLRGTTLAELRHRLPSGVFAPGEIIDWIGSAIAALRHLHALGWAHGDLHPGQMLIDPNGRLRLTGLGIAQIVSEVSFPDHGPSALAFSTKSPQQVAGALAAPADDIYALGASIFHLLTGQLVTSPLLARSEGDALSPMREVCARLGLPERVIDPGWDRLVQQCLATQREDRPTLDRLTEPLLALKLHSSQSSVTPPPALTPPAPLVPSGAAESSAKAQPLPPAVPPAALVPPALAGPPSAIDAPPSLPVATLPPLFPQPEQAPASPPAVDAPEASSLIELPELPTRSSGIGRIALGILCLAAISGVAVWAWRMNQRAIAPSIPALSTSPASSPEWVIVEPPVPGSAAPVAAASPVLRIPPTSPVEVALGRLNTTLAPTPRSPGSTPAATALATPEGKAPPAIATPATMPESSPSLRGTFRPALVPFENQPAPAATPARSRENPAPAINPAQAEQALLEQSRRPAATPLPSPTLPLPPLRNLSDSELLRMAQRLWKNEAAGTAAGLTNWRPGDAFGTFGIGRFTWYPAGVASLREETFPDLMQYLAGHGVAIPAWMNGSCPWADRDAFYEAFQEPRMTEVRELLKGHLPLQARLLAERLRLTVAGSGAGFSEEERTQMQGQYGLVAKTPRGIFAMLDFLLVQGAGAAANGSPKPVAGGLLQALLENRATTIDDAADRFSDSAERVLQRHPAPNPELQRQRLARVRGYSAEW